MPIAQYFQLLRTNGQFIQVSIALDDFQLAELISPSGRSAGGRNP